MSLLQPQPIIRVTWICKCGYSNRSNLFAQEHVKQVALCDGCNEDFIVTIKYLATVRGIEPEPKP